MVSDAFLHATPEERLVLIETRLGAALAPVVSIDVRDDSAQHAGPCRRVGRRSLQRPQSWPPDSPESPA